MLCFKPALNSFEITNLLIGYQSEGYWHLGASKIPLPDLFDHIGHLMNFMWTEAFCANEAVSEKILAILYSYPNET